MPLLRAPNIHDQFDCRTHFRVAQAIQAHIGQVSNNELSTCLLFWEFANVVGRYHMINGIKIPTKITEGVTQHKAYTDSNTALESYIRNPEGEPPKFGEIDTQRIDRAIFLEWSLNPDKSGTAMAQAMREVSGVVLEVESSLQKATNNLSEDAEKSVLEYDPQPPNPQTSSI